MKLRSWIVVADGDRARILKIEKPGVLVQIDCLHDPKARMKEHDLTSDRSGKRDSGQATCHRMEPSTSPHQKELVEFAKNLASYLEKAHRDKAFEHLYLAAGPHFLGILRQVIPSSITALISGECPKNLIHEPLDTIWNQLPVVV